MSHKATNWAIQQRGLQPAVKLVLWYLCDRHNPDYGCFPSQEQLADDAEVSRRTLNRHLEELEAAGLIRRERRVDARTRKQKSTRYILGFEADFHQEPCPEPGHGNGGEPCAILAHGNEAEPCANPGEAVCQIGQEPCAKNAENRVPNWHTNPVREPVKEEPVNTTTTTHDAREGLKGRELEALCLEAAGPGLDGESVEACMATTPVLDEWIEDGFDVEQDILPVIRSRTAIERSSPIRTWAYFTQPIREAYRNRTERAERPAVGPKAKNGSPDAPRATRDEMLAFYAKCVNGDGFLPQSAFSNTLRDALLQSGLVTPERMRERGIR